ncbi:MAG: PEP-utilizing enzyme [Patescibacteria group bacterium]
MHYWQKDLARLWQIVERKLARQPRYLEQMKRRHEQRFREFRATFSVIDKTVLGNISEADLFALWRRCVKAQIESVGASHVIEAINMALEDKIAKILRRAISDQKEYRRCFSLLTAPSQLSFVSREEKDLFALRARPAAERTTALAEHVRKYYWIRNSYVQAVAASDRYFSRRLATLKKPADNASARAQKARCLKTLDLSTEAHRVIELIDLCTIWQDERKEKVLRTITYLDRVINEVSRRVGVARKQLHYLSALEMLALTSPGQVTKLADELRKRSRGFFLLGGPESESVVSGREHDRLLRHKAGATGKVSLRDNELHATTANGGTAIGRVVICKGLRSLANVKKGDIIVASMTRPEFAPALKKAGAIVTDEGGITCHAAIVARELNIPCVIGAKIATEILRDGMIVEVKANHGVVKILNRS